MSQYPYMPPQPPGSYPPMGYGYYEDPLLPARRASVMLFVVGALTMLLGTCAGLMLITLPELMKNPEFTANLNNTPGLTLDTLKEALQYSVAIGLALGLLMILLGVFTRRGSMPAIITAIILTSLLILVQVVRVLQVAMAGATMSANGSVLAGAVCGSFVPLVLFGVQLALLIGAVRGAARAKAMREQQQGMPYGYGMPGGPPYGQPPMNPYAGGYVPPPPPGGGVIPRYPGYTPPAGPQQPPPRGPDAPA